jgi:NAD(P)-dependent dehydrogenase (short-subunit alcohol dehydrogenase family)
MAAPWIRGRPIRALPGLCPGRLVYLTSGMHLGGDPGLRDVQWEKRRWIGSQAYSDTKLHDLLLTFGVARRWPDMPSNAVSPGWMATRMGARRPPTT